MIPCRDTVIHAVFNHSTPHVLRHTFDTRRLHDSSEQTRCTLVVKALEARENPNRPAHYHSNGLHVIGPELIDEVVREIADRFKLDGFRLAGKAVKTSA